MQHTVSGIITSFTTPKAQVQLDRLMRLQCAARRVALKRLLEGRTEKEIVPLLKVQFLPNSRYCQWAVRSAEAMLQSRQELLPLQVRDAESKLSRSRTKLVVQRSKGAEAEQLAGLRARIQKLERKAALLRHHLEAGTLPSIVDGGRRRLRELSRGRGDREGWRDARMGELYSVGQANRKGNANTRLTALPEGGAALTVLIPNTEGRSQRLDARVTWTGSAQSREWLEHQLRCGGAYTIRIQRRKGNYRVHVSFDITEPLPDLTPGRAGIDINPDGIAVTVVGADGNFRCSRWFASPEWQYARAGRRDWLVGVVVRDALRWAAAQGVRTVVVEKLRFAQDHDTNRRFNRMSSQFLYRQILQRIRTRACREELAVLERPAAFSSVIGRHKYAETYGLSVHQAAALVMARRGLGFADRVPRQLVLCCLPKEGQAAAPGSWRQWAQVAQFFRSVWENRNHVSACVMTLRPGGVARPQPA